MRLSESVYAARKPVAQPRAEQGAQRFVKLVGPVAGMLLLVGAAAYGAFGLSQHLTTHAAQVNQNCVLIMPSNPLSAQGLASPYQLAGFGDHAGACHESNPLQSAFVQGVILDPATGKIAIYNPLVVDRNTAPAIMPTAPTLPAHAIVALWFGFNGASLHLRGADPNANCVEGLGTSIFGQVSYCNAPQFFAAANQLIAKGMITPPPLGMGQDGMTCPTVRDFSIVDQDQSDNVTTTYLVTGDGRMAQNTAANRADAQIGLTQVAANGSDNRLLSVAVDGALGCTPWMAPDLADGGQLEPAQALDELQAAAYQAAPIATVPSGDPMVLVNGHPNLEKQNRYRAGVDQAPVASAEQARRDLLAYCQNLYTIGPKRIQLDEPFTTGRPSLDPQVATNLFTFLAQRFNFTYGEQGLGCVQLLHRRSPITLRVNNDGVTVGATISYDARNGDGGTGGGNGDNTGSQSQQHDALLWRQSAAA